MAIDGTTGRLKYISNRQLSLKMDQTFLWYNSSDGVNVNNSQRSGAYIFRYVSESPSVSLSCQLKVLCTYLNSLT